MLLASDARARIANETDTFHNYYERMVREEIARALPDETDRDLLADTACVALNHLPPRYIRHDVDMAFYLSPRERMEMEDKVAKAVAEAIVFVQQRGGTRDAD